VLVARDSESLQGAVEPYVGAAESRVVEAPSATDEVSPPLVDASGGSGALRSTGQERVGAALAPLLHTEKRPTGSVSPPVASRISMKEPTDSGDARRRRRRRMHKNMTSKINRMIKPPRIPPTMAAMGELL